MDRRRFIQASAAGVAASTLSSYAAALADEKPKRVGLIGAGWYGKTDLFRMIQVSPIEVVSVCDVDKAGLAEAIEMISQRQVSKKKPRGYGDYRKMLAEKDLDIVIVGTPDHWHCLPTIAAIEAGADVYVEKPTAVDIVESQAMVAAARKHKRVVQVNTQRRSTPHLIEARDRVIKEGLLGTIGLVEIYCYYHMRNPSAAADCPPPETLDWEMYTGPAPMRPYNPIVHPIGWRMFKEYNNGILGDMCIHLLDAVRFMLGLGWPKTIFSAGGIQVEKQARANIPDTQMASFDYGSLQVVWQHRSWGAPTIEKYPWAITFYGDKGTLTADIRKWDFTPLGPGKPLHGEAIEQIDQYPDDDKDKKREPHINVAIRQHIRDFLGAVATRGKPVADIEEAHISTAACILANISQELRRSITWDAAKQLAVGDEVVNKMLARPYREPWVHPRP